MAAENIDLQQRVANLVTELDARMAEINKLMGDLSGSAGRVVELQSQVAHPMPYEAGQLSQPSFCCPPFGRGSCCSAYEIWIFAETKLGVYRDLHVEGRVTEE